MKITLLSFGYKYHHKLRLDMVLDCRCIINPYYNLKLKNQSGYNKEVIEYLKKDKDVLEYLSTLSFFIRRYLVLNKRHSVRIGFMCTGGFQRSVFLANQIYSNLIKEYRVTIKHYDL